MAIPPDLLLLERFLAGDATDDERALVTAWLAQSPEHAPVLDSLRTTLLLTDRSTGRVDVRAGMRRLNATLDRAARAPQRERPAVWTRYVSGIIAGATVMGIITMFMIAIGGPGRSVPRWQEYATAAGERSRITLPDGTRLTLAPESRLRLAADYGRGPREVFLNGEAYFAVVHDVAHPFTVHAGHAVATDIGTAFDVRAYATDGDVRVAVAEGQVGIRSVGTALMPPASLPPGSAPIRTLARGDVAVVTDRAVTVMHGVDVVTLVGWQDGRIAFQDVLVRDVVRQLSRWYDLDVRVTDSALAAERITLAVTSDSVAKALDYLVLITNARVERSGRTVTIVPRRTTREAN
jgi:ferric-dicitrate binding protein FerR (iron transport regulator)